MVINAQKKLGAGVLSKIICDKQNRVWITSLEGGLSCLDPGNDAVRNFDTMDGLTFNNLYSKQLDVNGNLRFNTSKGLVKIDPATFKIVQVISEGLGDFNRGGGIKITDSGNLYFFRRDVLTKIDVRTPSVLAAPPRCRIISISVGNATYDELELNQVRKLKLGYDRKQISFSFSSIAIQNADQYKFAYRLNEQDEWIETGLSRSVNFANLDDGHYLFEVRAAGPGQNWDLLHLFH